MGGFEVFSLVAGILVFLTGGAHVVFPRQVSGFFSRRNERRAPVLQDIRGISPATTRTTGLLQIALGLFLIYAGLKL